MDKGEIVLYQSQDGKISDEDSTVANFTTVHGCVPGKASLIRAAISWASVLKSA